MYCEIFVQTPPSGASVGVSGNVISGVIRYTVNIPTLIYGILGRIEGTGTLKIEHLQKKDDEGNPETEIRMETYLENTFIDTKVIMPLEFGVYEMPFSIKLPHDVPPSLNYHNNQCTRNVTCNIVYKVQISFCTSECFLLHRKFEKEIKIAAGLVPKLPMASHVYDGEKVLTQLFSSKKSYVKVKAEIFNSVLRCGDQIKLEYEVFNDTNIIIKEIKVKLIEIYTFKLGDGGQIVLEENVPYTDSKSGPLESGDTQGKLIDINIPVDRESLDFANIVSREYFVLIKAKLPMPHRNYELKIPVQIGHVPDPYFDAAPTWEIMNEVTDV